MIDRQVAHRLKKLYGVDVPVRRGRKDAVTPSPDMLREYAEAIRTMLDGMLEGRRVFVQNSDLSNIRPLLEEIVPTISGQINEFAKSILDLEGLGLDLAQSLDKAAKKLESEN